MTKDVKVFVRPSLDREKLTNKDLSDLITDFKKYKSGEKVHYSVKMYHIMSLDLMQKMQGYAMFIF